MITWAYRHIPSFRRERGGLYALYVAIYHPTYVATMKALHRAGRHGRQMASGRCQWCGAKPEGIIRSDKLLTEAQLDQIRKRLADDVRRGRWTAR